MKRISIAVTALIAVLAVPVAGAKVTKSDEHNAARECRAERGSTEAQHAAFADKYGTNANKRNAFGKCVSKKAHEAAAERRAKRRAAKRKAKHACRAERAEIGREAFAQKYGTNHNKRNAFGKCVSQQVKKSKSKPKGKGKAKSKAHS
jgi:Tfp pilus assembly protein PilV